jgi:hypothetical protein
MWDETGNHKLVAQLDVITCMAELLHGAEPCLLLTVSQPTSASCNLSLNIYILTILLFTFIPLACSYGGSGFIKWNLIHPNS